MRCKRCKQVRGPVHPIIRVCYPCIKKSDGRMKNEN